MALVALTFFAIITTPTPTWFTVLPPSYHLDPIRAYSYTIHFYHFYHFIDHSEFTVVQLYPLTGLIVLPFYHYRPLAGLAFTIFATLWP